MAKTPMGHLLDESIASGGPPNSRDLTKIEHTPHVHGCSNTETWKVDSKTADIPQIQYRLKSPIKVHGPSTNRTKAAPTTDGRAVLTDQD